MRSMPPMYGHSASGMQDRAVRLLVVLHHRDQRAAHRDARSRSAYGRCATVLPSGAAEPRIHPPRLEVAAVGAGADLAPRLLARQPDFQVDRSSPRRTRCRRSDSTTRRNGSSSRSSTVSAQRVIRSCSSALLVGVRDRHQLHLAELVLAQHAAGVAPGRARLAAEAVGQRGEAHRQRPSPPGSRPSPCWSAAPRRSGSASGRPWCWNRSSANFGSLPVP